MVNGKFTILKGHSSDVSQTTLCISRLSLNFFSVAEINKILEVIGMMCMPKHTH